MSAITKKKYVRKDMLEDFTMPKPHQTIVKIIVNRGSNLHQVLTPDGETYLASLPTHFRKCIWIKRGDFVVVDPIVEGDKVKAEIVRILYPQHIKEIKKANLWPLAFDCEKKNVYQNRNHNPAGVTNGNFKAESIDEYYQGDNLFGATKTDSAFEDDDSEDDFSDIPPNTNRPTQFFYESDDESSHDDETEDEL